MHRRQGDHVAVGIEADRVPEAAVQRVGNLSELVFAEEPDEQTAFPLTRGEVVTVATAPLQPLVRERDVDAHVPRLLRPTEQDHLSLEALGVLGRKTAGAPFVAERAGHLLKRGENLLGRVDPRSNDRDFVRPEGHGQRSDVERRRDHRAPDLGARAPLSLGVTYLAAETLHRSAQQLRHESERSKRGFHVQALGHRVGHPVLLGALGPVASLDGLRVSQFAATEAAVRRRKPSRERTLPAATGAGLIARHANLDLGLARNDRGFDDLCRGLFRDGLRRPSFRLLKGGSVLGGPLFGSAQPRALETLLDLTSVLINRRGRSGRQIDRRGDVGSMPRIRVGAHQLDLVLRGQAPVLREQAGELHALPWSGPLAPAERFLAHPGGSLKTLRHRGCLRDRPRSAGLPLARAGLRGRLLARARRGRLWLRSGLLRLPRLRALDSLGGRVGDGLRGCATLDGLGGGIL